MSPKMIFFNVGWMDFYQGLDKGDSLKNGGLHNKRYKWGGEILNFKAYKKKMFGYVQPVSKNQKHHSSTISIDRLDPEAEESISDVLVVWTATDPDHGGTYVIGWYKNATVFKHWQKDPEGSKRKYKGNPLGYFARASEKDCKLLPRYERTLRVPRSGPGSMGQSNVWFAEEADEFKQQVLDLIDGKLVAPVVSDDEKTTVGSGGGRQPDPEKRLKIEKAAVKMVIEHFTHCGYKVDSREKDNVGWDLDAVRGKIQLKLEVKGLSGSTVQADLTPNEFEKMKEFKESYVICIVTNALEKPELKVFYYSRDLKKWRAARDEVLEVEKKVGARVSLLV